jgi:hypothetical protein
MSLFPAEPALYPENLLAGLASPPGDVRRRSLPIRLSARGNVSQLNARGASYAPG